MNPFLYFVKLVSSFMFTSTNYPAFKFNLSPAEIYFDGAKNVSYFTACPASTEQEKAFNDRVSFTGNSVFLRNVHGPEENTTLKICDKPIEPGILYNSKSKVYEIGYELYYEQDKLKWKDEVNLTHIYRRVNITGNYEVIHNDTNKSLVLNDGASKLIFHWESVLSVACEGDNKQIQLCPVWYDDRNKTEMYVPDDALRGKCENENLKNINMKKYVLSGNDINSKESQNKTLPNLEQLKSWDNQSYDALVMSQLIPLWYYRDDWSKRASCSHLNMIPVWKSIAGQLEKVDLFLQAVYRAIPTTYGVVRMLFGASGVLTLKNETDIDQDQRQKVYLLQDNTQYSPIIPIPKIIYRVVEAYHRDEYYNGNHRDGYYHAVIVIHNDPNHVLDSERICYESQQLSGWERIKNDDPKTGLTYVCPINEFTERVQILQTDEQLPTMGVTDDLRLDSLKYFPSSSYSGSEYEDGTYYEDVTYSINQEFEELLNVTRQE